MKGSFGKWFLRGSPPSVLCLEFGELIDLLGTACQACELNCPEKVYQFAALKAKY